MVEYRQNFNAMKLSGVHRKPLNVGLVAKICRVSKKTVLNWIYKGALKAFQTLGGHYRIWPADLKTFLTDSAMDVPFQFVDERRTTFLIVDDDPAYSILLKEAICTHFSNADVIVTDDGYEGLLLIGERKPQMVILDLKMPRIDGYQVLELLRARKKDNTMKVVVLSAYVDNQIRERLSKSVADDIWEKGRNIKDILHSLDLMMKEKRPQRRAAARLAAQPVS